MAILYYGNGNCTIEGTDIRGVEIHYSGIIEIEDKTPDGFVIVSKNNGLMIFSIASKKTLNELFDYVGELKITSVIVANSNFEIVQTTIKRVMDYSELLDSKSEDLTVRSEDLSSSYTHEKKVSKTVLNQPHIENLNTSTHRGLLYLEDGTEYNGYYHIHISDSSVMTGRIHDYDSQILYYKQIDKNGNIVDKLISTKSQVKRTTRTAARSRATSVSGGGMGGGGGY
jgi:hypothetical protein